MTAAHDFLTREQVAARFLVTTQTVDNWIKAGHLLATKLGTKGRKGGRSPVRISAASVEKFSAVMGELA